MNADIIALSALRGFTVLLGAWIVILAYRAYRVSHRRSLGLLTAAVGLITLGAVAEGTVFNLGWSLTDARLVDASVNLAAMMVFAYALYARDRVSQRQRDPTALEDAAASERA